MSWKGECNCGAIQVTVKAPSPEKTSVISCHCMNCKKQSGAGGTYVLAVPNDNVTMTGTPKLYVDTNTDSGRTLKRYFCDSCGSPIFSNAQEVLPGHAILKMGLFNDLPKPKMELYIKNRLAWETAVEGAHQLVAGS